MDKLLSYISFACILIGLAGLTGTWEQEVTDQNGIILALVILAAGIIAGIIAAFESGTISRMKGDRHENRSSDRGQTA